MNSTQQSHAAVAATPQWQPIVTLERDQWFLPGTPSAPSTVLAHPTEPTPHQLLESGSVLFFPQLPFVLTTQERTYLDPAFSNAKRKSIYIRASKGDSVLGTAAGPEDQAALLALLQRYQNASMALLTSLFPGYIGQMKAVGTSFRPRAIGSGDAALSWRKDDTRLHVDAFPSNPTNGLRILRVFTNVGSTPRVWRVGPAFPTMAAHFLPRLRGPLPGSASLLHALHITKRKRSAYDHYMLQLHDAAKADLAYQRDCAQVTFGFPPGTTWVCYSDQVMHAAMSGQFMLEQTVHVPMQALAFPEQSPLSVLEKRTGKKLLD